jgi:MATE family multidrug resistance protein
MLRKTDHLRSNFLLAYPIMLSMLGQVMTGVADTVMIGWTGSTPLAAAAFANTFFSIPLFFCVGISYAITPLVAKAAGEGNFKDVNNVLKHGLLINICAGLLVTALIFSIRPFMYYMGQPEEVVTLALPYLDIIAPAIIPTMLFQTFRQFSEGLQHTRVAMVIVIGSNLLNIVLNYILIFGLFGFSELGLNGAGWATLVSRIVMGLSMAWYVWSGINFRKYRSGFSLGNYSRDLLSRMLNIGIPAGSQFIFEAGAFGFSSIMMGWIGTVQLAAHHIALNLATISYMTTSGLGAAATIKVGHYLGLKDIFNLRRSAFLMLWMAGVIMLLWAAGFLAGRFFLPSLYNDEPEVLRVAASLMIIAAFFQLSDGIQVVCAGALRGIQDVKIPSLLIFCAYWVLSLPMGWLLAFKLNMGAEGIWIGLLSGLTLTAIAMVLRFNHLSAGLAGKKSD